MKLQLGDIYEHNSRSKPDRTLVQYRVQYRSCLTVASRSDSVDYDWCVYSGIALEKKYRKYADIIEYLGFEPTHTLGNGYTLIPGGKISNPDTASDSGEANYSTQTMNFRRKGIRYVE